MKKLALILPPDLRENGVLQPAGAGLAQRLTRRLRERYAVTLILRAVRDKAYEGLPEGAEALLDTAAADMAAQPHPTYMQRGLAAWRAEPALPGDWDCVIALDGLHPWCLATALYRVRATRRLAYIPCEPRLYLSEMDTPMYAEAYAALDGVLAASRWTQEAMADMLPQVRCTLAHPPHEPLAEGEALPLEAGGLHILTVEPMEEWRQAERIPALAADVKAAYPALRWHVLGEGPRRNYLLRDVIACDVCEQVLPEGAPDQLNALLPQCSGVVQFGEENEGAAAAAQALGIPVLSLRREEGAERLRPWLDSLPAAALPRKPVWTDRTRWEALIDGQPLEAE